MTIQVAESIRSSHEFRCELPIEWLTRFDRNAPDRDAYKLLLVGACDPVSTFLKLDIAYPHNLEVKINGVEVRGHWKGLKNKPGTTKPVDITEYIRKTQGFANSLTVTYALTTKVRYLILAVYTF